MEAHARAVDARARGRDRAVGGTARQLGLLEAGRVSRYGLEPDVCCCDGWSVGVKPSKVAVGAAKALRVWIVCRTNLQPLPPRQRDTLDLPHSCYILASLKVGLRESLVPGAAAHSDMDGHMTTQTKKNSFRIRVEIFG